MGIGDLFSDFALPDSEILNPQMGISSQTWHFMSPIGDNMPNWETFMLVDKYLALRVFSI